MFGVIGLSLGGGNVKLGRPGVERKMTGKKRKVGRAGVEVKIREKKPSRKKRNQEKETESINSAITSLRQAQRHLKKAQGKLRDRNVKALSGQLAQVSGMIADKVAKVGLGSGGLMAPGPDGNI